jgi:hypothetical protein
MQGTTERFDCIGLDLNRPVDSIKEGHYPYLQNQRVNSQGQLEPRLGLTDLGEVVPGQSPVHSIRRLNDPASSAYSNVIGTGTHVAFGVDGGPYTDIDSGYSGNPLALMPYRPESSTASWMYIADSSRMRKYARVNGAFQTIGLAPPNTPPTANLTAALQSKLVSDFNSNADWTQGGDAGAPSNQVRLATTIAQILYDSGTTGWATVSPTSAAAIGPGVLLVINTGGGTVEAVYVEEVHPVSVATTIASIIYDSGTSGTASLVLAAPIRQAELNGLIRNTTVGPENGRILAVTESPDGNLSLRISTTNTWAAGNTVQILASFRAYFQNTHAAAEAIDAAYVRTAITFSTGTATLTDTIALDLSLYSATEDIHPEDYMHISIRVDRPDRVTELKVQLDVDSATNDFTRNFYTKSFRSNDLTPSVRNQQSLVSTRQQVIQRSIIDESLATPEELASIEEQNFPTTEATEAFSQQLDPGDTQWVELFFPMSDLVRVGTDESRTLQNIAASRIVAIVTGNVTLDLDTWGVRGGYGPDIGDLGSPYLYRYRARILGTNVASNFSPALRGGVNARRQSVTATLTQYAAPSGTNLTTGTDIVLDLERYGGVLPEWHYVATVANTATPSYVDILPDDTLSRQDTLGNVNFQPWPIVQPPASGTTGQVSGTSVNDAASNFNVSWAPGSRIRINGVTYTLYRVISTSRLELVENAGSQSAVIWQIDEPVLLGQPLPCLWGDEEFGAAFACGDPANPGRLYFSNPQSPDSTVESNYLDVTSPTEPLQNGLVWNGRAYVYSSERDFEILSTDDPSAPYYAKEIPGTGGLFSRWALTRNSHTPFIATLAKDGINKGTGGAAQSLTDEDLYPLFPNEGNLGVTVNSIAAPNIISAQAANLRIESYDNYLYFDYLDTNSAVRTLLYNAITGGWFFDIYTPTIRCHYGAEGSGVHQLLLGGTDGHLYRYAGNSDNGVAISCVVETPSKDQGAARINKLYEDAMLDLNPSGVVVSIIPGINNRSTIYAAVTSSAASRSQVTIPLGTAAQTARNISLRISYSVNSASRPILYLWEPRWAPETAPLVARRWSVSPTHFGMPNFKHIGTCKLTHVSSADWALTVTVDGVAQGPITIPNSSGLYAETYFRVPVFKGRLYGIELVNTSDARIAPAETWFEIGEWDRGQGQYQKVPIFAQS